MSRFRKGYQLPGRSGKTKVGYSVFNATDRSETPIEGLVWFEYKSDITKNNDPSQTKEFATKAETSSTVNDCVMRLLHDGGIPVAYNYEVTKTAFIAYDCVMLPLEVVARRYFVGSSLKRHPELERSEGIPPVITRPLAVEFYLKTNNGCVLGVYGEMIDLHLGGDTDAEDPIIYGLYSDYEWGLFHPKKPKEGSLLWCIEPRKVLRDLGMIEQMDLLMRRVFLTLETAWATLDLRLIDLKIEFGITPDGRLVVADVIDNDSWRLRTQDWQELSKQAFRDNEDLSIVEEKYIQVARLAGQLSYQG